MRQIKYRGISKSTGEWVYGYYSVFTYESQGGEFPRDDIGHFIMPVKEGNEQREEDEWVRVLPETVGQWTGLYAKGIEIYTDDIVLHNGNKYIVCYTENHGICFIHVKHWFEGKKTVLNTDNRREWNFIWGTQKYLEVIGSRHTAGEIKKVKE